MFISLYSTGMFFFKLLKLIGEYKSCGVVFYVFFQRTFWGSCPLTVCVLWRDCAPFLGFYFFLWSTHMLLLIGVSLHVINVFKRVKKTCISNRFRKFIKISVRQIWVNSSQMKWCMINLTNEGNEIMTSTFNEYLQKNAVSKTDEI